MRDVPKPGSSSGGEADERWIRADRFLSDLVVRPEPALQSALDASDAAGLPSIAVSAPHGKLLQLIARAIGARRILEIGTLGGYSGIWLARALPPDGKLITLELDPKHAEVARASFERAGLGQRVEVRVGRAAETLPQLTGGAPFDLVFIDADKPGYPEYFEWALKLSRPGTLILADNVVRRGAVADAASEDQNVRAIRAFLKLVASEPRVSATVVQTVGVKGYDGLAIILVNAAS